MAIPDLLSGSGPAKVTLSFSFFVSEAMLPQSG
jgi:hypothetical protein